MTTPPPGHGTRAAYLRGCHCLRCRAANSAYKRANYRGRCNRIDATGTARRLQALATLGWTSADLASRLRTNEAAVRRWRQAHTPLVNPDSAARVAALYEQLSGTPGPSARMRDEARRRGWVPPLLWEDIDIDDPTAQPHPDPEPPGRRGRIDLDDVQHLRRYGLHLDTIAERMGVRPSSITRVLERQRAQQRRRTPGREPAA